MTRKVSTKKYLIALILTLIVFAGGVSFGILIESARLNDANQMTFSEKLNLRSLQLQQGYIDSGYADCKALNSLLEKNIDELGEKMDDLISYEKNSLFNEKDFRLQLRDYFLTEIQFLLISEEMDKKCSRENVKVIYFYDENEQDTQGGILDYVKKLFGGRVLIFSLNSNFKEEPMISILLTSHNITQFPTVIIEDKVFQGHTSVEEVIKAVCNEFKTMSNYPELCEKVEKLNEN